MFRRMIDWFRRKRAWHRQWHLSWPPAIQPDAEGLTPFQRSCIARLTQSLPPDHQPLVWERLGSKETYLKTSVSGSFEFALIETQQGHIDFCAVLVDATIYSARIVVSDFVI